MGRRKKKMLCWTIKELRAHCSHEM
uniref:Uncharacterized protein n=1 Tax=Rhizophora mucronata TaxID=61149 RepID=A0A2P2PPR2_RHIMU